MNHTAQRQAAAREERSLSLDEAQKRLTRDGVRRLGLTRLASVAAGQCGGQCAGAICRWRHARPVEVPHVGQALTRSAGEERLPGLRVGPTEGLLSGRRRPGDRIACQALRQASVRDLGVHGPVGVGVVLVQVAPRGDGVVRGVAITAVDLERPTVPAHFGAEVRQGLDLRRRGRKDVRARVLVSAKQPAVELLRVCGANAVSHGLVPSAILGGPKARFLEAVTHVFRM
mmetsp:Transcript_22518/g.64816  ORF Transcript_22518/g.64816 Transcript_22518/m.64816 type:complete len:229 (+) Transcript_22518:225-911(+)